MSNVRLLTPTEVVQLVKIMEYCIHYIPYEMPEYDEMYEWVTEAIQQNKTKQLLTHENEKWKNSHSFRYGAESVMGTAREWLVFVDALLRGYDPEFIHDEKEQVIRGRDLRITTSNRSWPISVKPKGGKNEHEVRLAQEFFKPTYDPDGIAIVDYFTMVVKYYDYPHLKMFHNDNRHSHTVGDDPYTDRYWYPSPTNFMEFKF